MDSSADLQIRIAVYSARKAASLGSHSALLAVSGGADSVATAALLCDAGIIDARASAVAHFDHRLRGKDAARRDLAAVESLCDRFGLCLEFGAWDDPLPTEAAARRARYAFLGEAAQRRGLNVIVTGHTSDDQAETVLMHAMRGAGLHGLRGMAVESGLPVESPGPITLTRPSLCLTRAETRAYCGANNLRFADDPTNEDRRYLRNRIRLDMLGRTTDRAAVRASLLRLADDAALLVDVAEGMASSTIVARRGSEVVLSRLLLQALPPKMRTYAFRLAAEHLLGDVRDIERRHYELLAVVCDARTGAAFELPRGLVAIVDSAEIVLSIGAPSSQAIVEELAMAIPFEGSVGGWQLHIEKADAPECTHLMPTGAVVRRRRPGDRMRLAGGSRKLQDVLVDAKVPRRQRDGMPIIAVGSDVLWTPIASAVAPQDGGQPYRIDCERSQPAAELDSAALAPV